MEIGNTPGDDCIEVTEAIWSMKGQFYEYVHNHLTWWRYDMDNFSALIALCEGNTPVGVSKGLQ